MKNIERQKIELEKYTEMGVPKLQESVKEIEDKLKNMGFERSHRGPRIPSQTHTRDRVYSNTQSTVERGVKRQSDKTLSQVRIY